MPTGMRIGPYALDRVLGAGGMATVYLAHRADQQFEKHVAIKLVNQGLAARICGDRFQIERQILARLEHPNIARLLDAGLTEFGQPYLVMEWVDGVPLDEWVRERIAAARHRVLTLWLAHCRRRQLRASPPGRPPRSEAVERARHAATAPPKLVDFGIATLLEATAPAPTRDAASSRRTMPARNRCAGEAVTTSTDVYGLGLLLFELVTRPTGASGRGRRRPDAGGARTTSPRLVRARRSRGHPRHGAAGRARTPLRHADQFADDVRRYWRGWPVTAQPESWRYNLRRFVGPPPCRRRAGRGRPSCRSSR